MLVRTIQAIFDLHGMVASTGSKILINCKNNQKSLFPYTNLKQVYVPFYTTTAVQ